MKNITWVNILLGVWLVIAPFALSTVIPNHAWTANDVILGVLLIAASWAIVSMAAPSIGVAWFEVLCGVWLVVAPFVLHYSGGHVKLGNDVISGIIAIVIAAIALTGIRRPHVPSTT
ncbi:MAG TPA: SPW repeat protein [Vicinamibacterales bacterium]|nr:SPW repeat protein [Vicinamibacterales bacterium]